MYYIRFILNIFYTYVTLVWNIIPIEKNIFLKKCTGVDEIAHALWCANRFSYAKKKMISGQ